MTETPNFSPENQQDNPETTNNRLNLKQALEEKLADKNITPEEAKVLQKEMKDILIKTSDARKQWRKLSYQLRTEFQDAVWANADGAIWTKTMDALNKLSLSEQAEFKEKVEKQAKTAVEIANNITQTRDELSKIHVPLEDELIQVEIIKPDEIEDESKFKLNSASVTTGNDGMFGEWDDMGKSFSIAGGVEATLYGKEFSVNAEVAHYTDGIIPTYNETGKRLWNQSKYKNWKSGSHNDLAIINGQTKILSLWDDSGSLDIQAGWWIQLVWDMGLDKLRDAVHKNRKLYKPNTVAANQSWITPHISWSIAAEKIILWDSQSGVFIEGEWSAVVPLNIQYGKASIDGKIWIWANYGNYSLTWYVATNIEGWVTWSETIHNSLGTTNYVWAKVTTPVPFMEKSVFYVEALKDVDGQFKNNHQFSAGVQFNF